MGFKLANVGGRAALVSREYYYDIETVSNGKLGSDPMAVLESLGILSNLASSLESFTPTGKLDDVELGPPVPRPRNCFAVGLNYRNHAKESQLPIPDVPMVFAKHSTCITGPTSNVQMRSDYVDYEAELVVVVGTVGKNIAVESAWDHVAGLCIGQDISDRTVQLSGAVPQFNLGKSFDTFGPIGPWLVSPDELDNPSSLQLVCKVNGQTRQMDNTRDFIFGIPAIISYLSEIVTLQVGDLIFTGTPAGVAAVDGNYLQNGDLLTTSIEGLGTMNNRCVRISDHSNADVVPETYSKMIAAMRDKK
jgi:2,4-diketo-3-deoxy-L-fuconate hydrolase